MISSLSLRLFIVGHTVHQLVSSLFRPSIVTILDHRETCDATVVHLDLFACLYVCLSERYIKKYRSVWLDFVYARSIIPMARSSCKKIRIWTQDAIKVRHDVNRALWRKRLSSQITLLFLYLPPAQMYLICLLLSYIARSTNWDHSPVCLLCTNILRCMCPHVCAPGYLTSWNTKWFSHICFINCAYNTKLLDGFECVSLASHCVWNRSKWHFHCRA